MRRINYLLLWTGCLIFFWAYRQWICWFALVAVTLLPLLSLLVSLPAICTAKIKITTPDALTMEDSCPVRLTCASPLPTPHWECTMELTHSFGGHTIEISDGTPLPTEHCGMLTIQVTNLRIWDYLGLFRLSLPVPTPHHLLIRPIPVSENLPLESDLLAGRLCQPQCDMESFEPRPARPGDIIRYIHQKLSIKTGKLILNEPTGTEHRALLRLHLQGTEAQLDQKLGLLLWLGALLLEYHIPHQIECYSASGCERWSVDCTGDLSHAVDCILSRSCTPISPVWRQTEPDMWVYEIGGDANEV